MIKHPLATTQTETHTYALNWTAEAITWLVDGKAERTLKYADANGGKTFPQTPCNVRLGNWPGGDSEDKGTVEWAGGKVDYTQGPFTMTVESIKVINYSPGTEYKWTDKTGSHESIEVIGAGDKNGAPVNSVAIEPSATAPSKPLASGIDAPGAGSKPETPQDTTCTTGAGSVQTTAVPLGGGQSGFAYPTGTHGVPKPSGGAAGSPPKDGSAEDTPCSSGTVTVTVTGPPPAATFTTQFAAIPPASITTKLPVPIVSSVAGGAQPPASPPPYPTSGIMKETRPPPIVPNPTAPSAVLPPTPSRNATASAPAQFTGAASHNKAGVLVGALAGAVLLAF
jgi:hypothetical protein